jgi:hypothetical protein
VDPRLIDLSNKHIHVDPRFLDLSNERIHVDPRFLDLSNEHIHVDPRFLDLSMNVYMWNHVSSAIVRDDWLASCSSHFALGIHWIEGWVGPPVSLDDVEKRKFLNLPGLKLNSLVIQPLYLRRNQLQNEIMAFL